ncbi:MAG: CBS domain-containing protein [Nitrososphaerales archaeon]|nr:CBS domain-containing protein [Nitrososphaerales archaeon]
MSESRDVVGKIMSRTVRTVSGSEPVSVAVAKMVKHDIGSVVVLEGGAPVGIITERDIMRQLTGKSAKDLSSPSKTFASKPLVTVSPETEIWNAFTIMLRKKIRRLPVVQGGRLMGIVTERDLFKWVVGVFYEPNVPADIKKLIVQNP